MKNEQIKEQLKKLEEKYEAMGQDISSYLDGLLLSNYLTYWDYIKVDTLLTLQQPKTDFPDEEIFIVYHQITELYFKLVLHEVHQIAHNGRQVFENGFDEGWNEALSADFLIARLKRINQYFDALTKSFDIMVQGMEKEQFLRFRMALLPASGFQSAQYRKIEMACTPMINMVQKDKREELKNASISEQFEYIYWKLGATELKNGKKTLTLRQFEKKYTQEFLEWAATYEDKNIWKKYQELSKEDQQNEALIEQLRNLDLHVNVFWPLVHYKSAVRYLQLDTEDIAATGGTNWQKYLPPRFQKRIFFPDLWSTEEQEEWGKGWVIKEIFGQVNA